MPFDYRERHHELSELYRTPFLPHDNLPRYDDESCLRDAERNIRYFVEPFVSSFRMRSLEVGCGRGALSALLASRGAEAIGIDKIDFSTDWRLWERPGLTLRRADFLYAELGSECFDLLVSVGTWEHLYDPVGALERSYRLLRPGGLFIAHIGMYFSRRGSHMYRLLNYPHPTLFFNEEELEDIVGEEVPFVNTMTCSHYRDFCGRIGFRTLLWQEIEEPAEAAMLRRYPKTFQKFPVEDLRVPLLNVVLWKPRRDELPSYPGVPRVTRGPAADWREGLARIHPFQVESRYGAAAHFLRARPRILDVGCRTGAGAQYLAQLGGDVVGIDSDRAAIQLARRRPGGASFVCGKPLPVLKELTRQLDLVVLDAAAVCAASYTSQAELAMLVCRRLARGGIVMIHSASESYLSERLARNGLRMIYDGPALTRTGGRATMGPCLQVLEDRNGRSTER